MARSPQPSENFAHKEQQDAKVFLRLPAKADVDVVHIAVATVHGMDYLLTWNCKHIANAQIQRKLAQLSFDLE